MILHKISIFIIFLALVLPLNISAQQKTDWQEILLLDRNDFNPYVEFVSEDITDFFNPESGNSYPSTNLFDGYFKTCWVSGSAKSSSANLYIRLSDKIDLNEVILNIFSGYGKNKNVFYSNARPKRIDLSLFSAFYPEGFSTEVASLYIMKKYPYNKTLNLADTFDVQSFPLKLNRDELLKFQKEALTQAKNFSGPEYNRFARYNHPESFSPFFILKMEISDVYLGTNYDDVCVSEVFFNDRFITNYPNGYNEISNVYIDDDNTLLADYTDKKGFVIYKDTSSVFTYVDWPENANWAILHYVANDAEGGSSRVEEQYLLVDLKNKEIVDTRFHECTGKSVMFQYLEKKDDGTIYIDDENYEIELK